MLHIIKLYSFHYTPLQLTENSGNLPPSSLLPEKVFAEMDELAGFVSVTERVRRDEVKAGAKRKI